VSWIKVKHIQFVRDKSATNTAGQSIIAYTDEVEEESDWYINLGLVETIYLKTDAVVIVWHEGSSAGYGSYPCKNYPDLKDQLVKKLGL
jgi:hypothetical protein